MNKKDKKQLKKEKKQRKKLDKMKRREYTKEHLKLKDKRTQTHYEKPKSRLVLIKDFIRSKDLRKAIALFLGSQVSIFLLLLGADYPHYAPIIGSLSVFIGLLCIIFTVREINRRQALDPSRRPVDFKLAFKIIVLALVATTLVSSVFTSLGITPEIQPNQESINNTLIIFPLPMIFTTLIVAPFIEEIVFRELLPFATGPSILSFILTTLIFVAVHSPSGLVGWINYGIVAGSFLYARLKNNNVYAGILVHLSWNLLSLIV